MIDVGPVQATPVTHPSMAHSSSLPSINPNPQVSTNPAHRSGLLLAAILGLALGMSGTGALVASGLLSENSPTRAAVPIERAPSIAQWPAVKQLALPGFQRRGNLLTGELRTNDGTVLRLVIDARTNMLVGYRVIEPIPPAETAKKQD
ncbi:hypothetical protein MCEMSEM23_01555 [Rhabdaerophilaceae bacterium]